MPQHDDGLFLAMLEEAVLYGTNATSSPAKGASVLIVGTGALGCAAAALLARAGIERLTLVDPDLVEPSNLQRQLLFARADLGRAKAPAAARALKASCKGTTVRAVVDRLTEENAQALLAGHGFVIDACDDPAAKLVINAAAVRAGIPCCYGGVVGTSGQLMSIRPGQSACLECVFPSRAQEGDSLGGGSCSEMGILACVAGVVGSLQALEALKALRAPRHWRPGVMTIYEVRGKRWRTVDFARRQSCAVCGSRAAGDAARRLEACRM